MVRTPFQGDFVVRIVPRAEALGCFLLALQAIGTHMRKCPNSSGRFGKPTLPIKERSFRIAILDAKKDSEH
jgi:hypothetical protein